MEYTEDAEARLRNSAWDYLAEPDNADNRARMLIISRALVMRGPRDCPERAVALAFLEADLVNTPAAWRRFAAASKRYEESH